MGQLEARDDEQAVEAARSGGFRLDLAEIRLEVGLADIALVRRVIGDREHVEAGVAVEVDELADGKGAVTPRRVGVELAEKRVELRRHP